MAEQVKLWAPGRPNHAPSPGLMEWPLILMDPDDYGRRRFAVMFCVLSVIPRTAIFLAASTARENAADSREQGGNAY